MPLARLAFPRSRRLKDGRDFRTVRNEGERKACGCLLANWRRVPPGTPTRLGVVTSGKLGNAVVRGRARRLLREAFRLHQFELSAPVEIVLVARQSIVGKKFAEVEADFLKVLRQARLLGEAT